MSGNADLPPTIPSLLAFLCVWLSPKVMEGLPASMGKNPPKKYTHLFIYKTEHGICQAGGFQVLTWTLLAYLKERHTVAVGVHRGAPRNPWIQRAQTLESHDKLSVSPVPHPQVQPTPDRVVVLLKKYQHISGPARVSPRLSEGAL